MIRDPDRFTLLIAEDSDEDFDTVREALERCGLPADLRRAGSGGECVQELRKLAPQGGIVVLMDLNMPGIDGREALGMIKSDPALKELPVVVWSTSADPRDLSFCYAAGANAYHVKPVRYPEHLAMLTDLFRYWFGSARLPEARSRA